MTRSTIEPEVDLAQIAAAQLVAEAAALRLTEVALCSAACRLRTRFPTATSILVDTESWHADTEPFGVDLMSVHDLAGTTLWSLAQTDDPETPDTASGWDELRAGIEWRIGLALTRATPTECGWTKEHDGLDHVYRIPLPSTDLAHQIAGRPAADDEDHHADPTTPA